MVDNDQDTTGTDDQQTLTLDQPADKVVAPELTEEQQKIADLSEADIANQTFSNIGKPEPKPDEPVEPKPKDEDDPDEILVPKDSDDIDGTPKPEEKLPPRKGSAEWYELRLANKDAHIKNLEEDNYGYRQQRRESKLDQSRQQHQAQIDQLQDFDVLSAEEENNLIRDNPDDYKTYVRQLDEYNKLKGQVGKENGQFTPDEHADFQLEEYDDFLKQAFQFDYAAEAKKDRELADKRYEELNADLDVIEMAGALKQYQPGKSGLYTAKQMFLLYQGVTKDSAVTTAAINARKNVTTEINTAQERVNFDGLPKAEAGAVPKNPEDLTPTEIANMGPADLKVANEAIQAAMKKQEIKDKGTKTKGR